MTGSSACPFQDAALIDAAKTGNFEAAEDAFESGANINAVERDTGTTPLIAAADEGHLEIAEALLAAGADVNASDRRDYTALHYAANGGAIIDGCFIKLFSYPDMVALLIEAGAELDAVDTFGCTPLRRAVGSGHLDSVQLLLAAGADPNAGQDWQSLPLREAAFPMNLEIAHLLLEAGADPQQAKCEFIPLFVAADRGDAAEVGRLIEAGADVEATGDRYSTPLLQAAMKGNAEVIRLLVAAGADLDARSVRGFTPLILAASRGHSGAVAVLVDADVVLDATHGQKYLALFNAIRDGHVAVVRILIDAGGSVNDASTSSGRTPLHEAAFYGQLEIVKMLLAAGADPVARDSDGITPWDCATMSESRRNSAYLRPASCDAVAELLKAHGA